jgi:hypothetical protein
MGWNDRLPEDPYIPYESQADADAYENWRMYVEGMFDAAEIESGLTSNNVQFDTPSPAQKVRDNITILDRLRAFMKKTAQRRTDCGAPMQQD